VTDAPKAPSSGRTLLLLLAILAVTAGVYRRALTGDLVYDDLLLVARNPLIADLANVPQLFGQAYWDFLDAKQASSIGYWRPLSATGIALAYAVGDGSTWMLHAFCLAVHLFATVAAFLVVRDWLESVSAGLLAALIFGLHPVHVESVAWISALNDPLFGMLGLFAIHRYQRWRARGSRGIPLAAALLFGLALLAKELALAVVPMLMLIDLGRPRVDGEGDGPRAGLREPVRAYAPFAAVFGIYVVARMFVFDSLLAGFDRTTSEFAVGPARLLMLRVELLGGGLRLLLAPLELALFRPFRPVLSPADGEFLVALALCVALAVAAVVAWRRAAWRTFGALMLTPVGLFPALLRIESVGIFPVSERFLYLPVLGFAVLLIQATRRVLPVRAATLAVLVVAALHGVKSWQRTATWQNEEALFRASAEAAPRSPVVFWSLGRVLLDRYRTTGDRRYLDEADNAYFDAQQLLLEARQGPCDILVSEDDFLQTQLGVGWCEYFRERDSGFKGHAASIEIFRQLIDAVSAIREREEEARRLGIQVRRQHLALELPWTALGTALHDAGDLAGAEEAYNKAIALNDRVVEARHNLAQLHFQRREFQRARQSAEAVLELAPGRFQDELLVAQCLYEEGFPERAKEVALGLHERDATHPEPLVLLGVIELAARRESEALRWIDLALEADPSHGFGWYQKAKALAALGSSTSAVEAFVSAATLRPDNFEVRYDCGAYLLQQGAIEAAEPHLLRAYQLVRDPRIRTQLQQAFAQMGGATAQRFVALSRSDRMRGDVTTAQAWIARALELDPNDGPARLEHGRLLRQRGLDKEAADELVRACQLLPDDFEAWSETGELLASLGRPNAARTHLERCLALDPPASWEPGLVEAARRSVEARLQQLDEAGAMVGPSLPADG
jgi:tetratricopeptide (TPR) repeat protein